MTLHEAYIYLSQASILLPMLAGFIYYRRLNTPFRYFTWFFALAALVEVGASLLKSYIGNNLPLLHIFIVMEFAAFVYLYQSYLPEKKVMRWLIPLLVIAFLGTAIYDVTRTKGIWLFNSSSRSFESLVMVVFSLRYYYLFFNDPEPYALSREPMFWVNTGVFIYFSLNLFLFMLINYLLEQNPGIAIAGMDTHAAINIIANVLFAKSFLCFRPTTT